MSPAPEHSQPGDEDGPPGRRRSRRTPDPREPDPPRDEPGDSSSAPLQPPVHGREGAPGGAGRLQCRRCQKQIVDLEMEVYFLQTGLCFWCAYVDSQG